MLLKNFYTINKLTVASNLATVNVTINKDHEIFKGHFPDNPVTPGVCMMQITKEITQKIVEKPLFMEAASNIKFMAIINPNINPDLELTLEIDKTENGYKVKNTTKFNDTLALKLTSNFIEK